MIYWLRAEHRRSTTHGRSHGRPSHPRNTPASTLAQQAPDSTVTQP
ncbi:hypothetical protein BSU04_03155 [Caballeronia sordidicola]|uniref:Uncharacterized protein n=1 Tax=Caballeronia sordidicola TaxID=196367 RepID=A0A226X9X9_CABSO|nr:hypothetical protein BSU04_03155 [Caballeronia sordidicola]